MLTSKQGVLAVLALVVAVDVTAKEGEQITDWFRAKTQRHPIGMRIALALLAGHLTRDLPVWGDPVSGVGWALAKLKLLARLVA